MTEAIETKRRSVGFWRWVWRITAATFATVVVLLALGVGLFRVLVPMFPDYQQRIEAAATKALGHPIAFSGVDARWRLRGPELVFNDVRLRSAETNQVMLSAGRCRVVLDVWSLIKGDALRPAAVELSDTSVQLDRDVAGEWSVQGESLAQWRRESRCVISS